MRSLLRIALAGVALIACNSDQPPGPNSTEDQVTANAFGPGPTQYVTVPVQVAPAFATAPFNVTRSLTIPSGFSIKVFARVSGARFLAVTPDGRTLVSNPGTGIITLLTPNGTGLPLSSTFVSGLAKPQDMVFYQPTPARHVVALIDQLALGPGDTLVDLGSGLGHVPMLVNILTGASTLGIELQASLAERARETSKALGLQGVSFVHGDARVADLSAGTVFYLYTPFKGAVMDEALARLAGEARDRPLRIATFGPCTSRVAAEPWLVSRDMPGENGVCVFRPRERLGMRPLL